MTGDSGARSVDGHHAAPIAVVDFGGDGFPVLFFHGLAGHGASGRGSLPDCRRVFTRWWSISAVTGTVRGTPPIRQSTRMPTTGLVPRAETATAAGAGHNVHLDNPVEFTEVLEIGRAPCK